MTVRGRLLLADAAGLLFEGAAITVPAVLLYGLAYGNPGLAPTPAAPSEVLQLGPLLMRPVAATLLLFSLIYFFWQEAWLRRLRLTADPAAHRDLVYATAASLPRHSHLVRTLLWSLCGLLCVGWLARIAGLRAWPLLWLFSLNPLLAGALHSMAYDRLLWGVPWRSLPSGPDPLRRLNARYRDELDRATLLTTGLCIVVTITLTSPIPFHLESYQSTQRYLPALLLLLLLASLQARRRACAPINAYLRAALTPYPPPRALAAAALRAAQRLPYLLGAVLAGGGSAIAGLVLLLLLPGHDVPWPHLGLLFGVALCTVLLCALGAVLWHRSTLRPLLQHLLGAHVRITPGEPEWPPADPELPAPLSLAARVVGSFGLVVLCAGALTLLWSLIQFNNLATRRIQSLASERLQALVQDLARLAPTSASAAALSARLAHGAHLQHESLLFYLAPGERHAQLLAAPPGLPSPLLPPSAVAQMQRRRSGQLDLPQVQLAGVFTRVALQAQGEATLALLYPDYRHPGEGGLAPAEGQRAALLWFCAVLLFASSGIVVVTTVDLARPVRYLERRATAIAAGDLQRPVRQALVDTDELGRLTLAFEEMRRALSEKLRSSTQLNLALEVEVQRRTKELTLRNQEVSEALARLRQARDELLRTERLATMGRIAAGVSSEINNPVNVMANLCDPLSEELQALQGLVAQRPLKAARVAEVLGDLRSMVDALLRGAQRAKEIVQATRIHLRNASGPPEPLLLTPVLDAVLMLFADLRHHGVLIERDHEEGLQVLAVRGDLAQLLSGWLARVTPRLRQAAQRPGSAVRLTVRTRRAPPDEDPDKAGPALVELSISDNGPPLSDLSAPAEHNLAARLAARIQITSGEQTVLLLHLPRP